MDVRTRSSLVPFAPLLSFLVVSTVIASAQTSAPHIHPGLAPTQQIDGSVNPEKISDLTAYRMFFLVAGKAPDAKPEDRSKEHNRQQVHLKKIGITDQDSQLLIPILDDFRARYSALVRQYNTYAEATAARGQAANSASFLVQRDNLVQATRDKLKALSFDGQSRFDTHVQSEKQYMKSFVPVLR